MNEELLKMEIKNAVRDVLKTNTLTSNADNVVKMGGKEYRNVRRPRSESDYGEWEFFYNGKWHEVLSYDIRKKLNRLL